MITKTGSHILSSTSGNYGLYTGTSVFLLPNPLTFWRGLGASKCRATPIITNNNKELTQRPGLCQCCAFTHCQRYDAFEDFNVPWIVQSDRQIPEDSTDRNLARRDSTTGNFTQKHLTVKILHTGKTPSELGHYKMPFTVLYLDCLFFPFWSFQFSQTKFRNKLVRDFTGNINSFFKLPNPKLQISCYLFTILRQPTFEKIR